MLNQLNMKGVGPAESLTIDFKPRLNFLTGDNGLGKSFILDIAWWALTRTWARGVMAVPRQSAQQSSITYSYTSSKDPFKWSSQFDHEAQQWAIKQGRPAIPGVVIYAGVDGSFSVWDPARNYWKSEKGEAQTPSRPSSFDFTPEQVWSGLQANDRKTQLCNGLLHDWVSWQDGKKDAFDDLVKVLDALSPSGVEKIKPGSPMRVGDSVKELPSLCMPYGQNVPLIHASAGMRRIATLAYLLVWTWREHQVACERFRVSSAREIIFLVDEIECHLHPQWQRRIVPALLNVMTALTSNDVPVQLLVATHSPLVLTSVEPTFEAEHDCIWDFDLVDNEVEAHPYQWSRKGGVNAWLTSGVFNLKEPVSVQAEEALEQARTFLRTMAKNANVLTQVQRQQLLKIDALLRASLSEVDAFWIRWSRFRDELEAQA